MKENEPVAKPSTLWYNEKDFPIIQAMRQTYYFIHLLNNHPKLSVENSDLFDMR